MTRYMPARIGGKLIAAPLHFRPKSGLWCNPFYFPYGGFHTNEAYASREGALVYGLSLPSDAAACVSVHSGRVSGEAHLSYNDFP